MIDPADNRPAEAHRWSTWRRRLEGGRSAVSLSDRCVVVMAVGAVLGAHQGWGGSTALAAALGGAGLVARSRVAVIVAVILGASALGARSHSGLEWNGPPAYHAGPIVLVSDPRPFPGSVQVDARVGGRRVVATANGDNGRVLARRMAGERMLVSGWVSPVPDRQRARLAARHISARMQVVTVGDSLGSGLVAGAANHLRRVMLGGVGHFSAEEAALWSGLVLGADQASPATEEAFRGAGLSHLLVVSGQNVAFVLAAASPILRRLSLRAGLLASLALLGMFGTLTRWEPSVIRAVTMAGLVALAFTWGRPASRLRILALAVSALVLVDPLLARSLSFGLSVSACLGIILFAPAIARMIPGPRPVASAMAVTLGAQAAVAPLLFGLAGPLPLGSVPANLLAGPAAAGVMVWGMAVGPLAGLAAEPVAVLAHLPTRLLLGWLSWVADFGSRIPGQVGPAHLMAGSLGVALAARGSGACGLRRLGAALAVVAVVVAPLAQARRPSSLVSEAVAPGARVWRQGPAVVLVVNGAGSNPRPLMAGLARHGVRHVDVLVLGAKGQRDSRAVAPLLRRRPPELTMAAAGSTVAGVVVPSVGWSVQAGRLTVTVLEATDDLAVTVNVAK
ncbi:MAG: ComEC/Rec2 family competence protein [Acidimicrobiales bacterium]